ncbi:hypothetical protein NQ024_01200, partial [Corynebacterium sp. 35RC1]|nr:hypothetical protein [Corynebacterium sp. 35RC1]
MTALNRFIPLVGILVLLIAVALAGAALSSSHEAPRIDPASATLTVGSTTPPSPAPTTSASTAG